MRALASLRWSNDPAPRPVRPDLAGRGLIGYSICGYDIYRPAHARSGTGRSGSAELIIPSIVETRARHGHEISRLIETRSAGQLKFHIASLYPLLYRLEERGWLQGRWRRPASAGAASTGSRPRAAGSSPASGTPGRPSSARCASSPEWIMPNPSTSPGQGPDWSEHLRPWLASLRLSPAREQEIADELSSTSTIATNSCAPRARRSRCEALALEELDDHDTLAREMRALRQAQAPPPISPGSPRRGAFRDILQDLRYAACMLRRQPGFIDGRSPHPRARHRCQHRGVQPGERDTAAAASGRRS